jgi:outer membrane lipoprotein-sorting protein
MFPRFNSDLAVRSVATRRWALERRSIMSVRHLIACALLCPSLLATSLTLWGQSTEGSAETAKGILAEMATAYSSCKSYQDKGRVQITFVEPKGNRTQEIRFWTAFVRPDHFRFEYIDRDFFNKERCFIIWKEGFAVRAWWDLQPGIKSPQSLELALAGATGVSNGSAHTIPALLLPDEVGGKKLTDLRDPELAPDATISGEECYVIKGHFLAKDKQVATTIWICKHSHLVLQIEQRMSFETYSTIQVTTYESKLDGEIPTEALAFTPPAKG